MKKCAAFPGGALTDFGFQKGGVGWVRAPARASRPFARCRATPGGSGYRLPSPKLVCNALDRASPVAERLGHLQDTHALRKLLSHLAFVVLSIFGRPSFTPWATARLRPALIRWRIMLRSNSAKDGGGDRPVQGDTGRSAGTENCRFAGGGRGDTQLVTEARSRFEGPYKSLQHQAQDWGSLTVKGG